MMQRWLGIQEAQEVSLMIQEQSSFRTNVLKNRIWYRGDPSELSQFFQQTASDKVTQARFWASVPSKGNNIRKWHSGLPGLMVNILSDIVVTDMQEVDFTSSQAAGDSQEVWKDIAKENDFKTLVTRAIQEVLVVGDGAFKVSFDTDLSPYPILEFFSGEKVDYVFNRGRIQEVKFYTPYQQGKTTYTLVEHYAKNAVFYELRNESGDEVPLSRVEELADLQPVTFEGDYLMAVPFLVYPSPKWEGRGRSIFDLKTDSFDALDETISQWQDAIRLGRIKRYIPQSMVPRDPKNGKELPLNLLDNQYTAIGDTLEEGAENRIFTDQPSIQYDGYIATYINNLDLCLQGIISPSTLGIDTKKLDNAEAQREKEKTTLYTRQKIVSSLQACLPEVVNVALKSYRNLLMEEPEEVECTIDFGEYANPSFEAQIETIGKAAASQIMSIESQVETLWGDSKTDTWKKKEVERLKREKGISEVEEPTFTPHGFMEESMIDDMDRPGDRSTDSDGDTSLSKHAEELEKTHDRGDEGGEAVDAVAGHSVEKRKGTQEKAGERGQSDF